MEDPNMVSEELEALQHLPEWAVLVLVGNYLGKRVAPTEDVTDNEMVLLLAVLHLVCRVMTLRWEARQAADRPPQLRQEECDSSIPFGSEPGLLEPWTATTSKGVSPGWRSLHAAWPGR
jgi:hypothetical protein